MSERRTKLGTDYNRLLHLSITSSSYLDHSTLCYLRDSTDQLFCFSAGVAQPEVLCGPQAPVGCFQWLQSSSDLAFTDSKSSKHLHILFHKAYKFWYNPAIFFRFFTQVRLWLTAWSRVNMQHSNSVAMRRELTWQYNQLCPGLLLVPQSSDCFFEYTGLLLPGNNHYTSHMGFHKLST